MRMVARAPHCGHSISPSVLPLKSSHSLQQTAHITSDTRTRTGFEVEKGAGDAESNTLLSADFCFFRLLKSDQFSDGPEPFGE